MVLIAPERRRRFRRWWMCSSACRSAGDGHVKKGNERTARRLPEHRRYLTLRGVPADGVRAEGMGPVHPVADNASAAGRASNRRIEIVIEVSRGPVDRGERPLRAGRQRRASSVAADMPRVVLGR